MRIAFNAVPVRPGGGLTVLLGLLHGLAKLRTESEFIVFCSASDTLDVLRKSQVSADIVQVVPDATNGQCYLWQNFRLGRELDQHNVDVLLTFNHFLQNVRCKQVVYHLNIRRFSKEFRDKRLTSVVRETLRDLAARRALSCADANVFESEFLRNVAEETIHGTAKSGEVIYIGLPESMLSTLVSAVRVDRSRIISITSPHPHKDNETMIRTLAELVRLRPAVDWQLDVAGGHHESVWDPFRALAAEVGVRERITWHGFCEHERLDNLLRRSLCLLATSAMESFAMVPIEGMARGCPPIVANTSSMPESVGDAGVLVTPHDPVAFAAAILKFHDDHALRQSYVDAGFMHVRTFKWSKCGQRFSQLIDRICA